MTIGYYGPIDFTRLSDTHPQRCLFVLTRNYRTAIKAVMSDLDWIGIEVPEDLRLVREFLGMTQLRMSEFLCVGVRQYRRWESGEAAIPKIIGRYVMIAWDVGSAEEYVTLALDEAGISVPWNQDAPIHLGPRRKSKP